MIAEELEGLAVPLDELSLFPGNPRRGDVDAIARSLEAFGQVKPIVATVSGVVVAGNHTLLAARQLGWPSLAVVRVSDDETRAAALALADNRTAELGSYDPIALAELIQSVAEADEALLEAISYSAQDLEDLLNSPAVSGAAGEALPAEVDDVPDSAPELTSPGDLWLLGPHRLLCGDCRSPADVARVLDGATVNLAVTSPPYAEQRDYDESSGFVPIPAPDYVDWFEPVAANVGAHLAEDGSWLINIKPPADGLDTDLYVVDLVAAHVRRWGWHFATEFCWERVGFPKGPFQRLKNQFEPIYQFAKSRWKFRPDNVRHFSEEAIIAKGVGGTKDRLTDLADLQGQKYDAFPGMVQEGWAYPGNRLPTFQGSHQATGHAAAFPVGLPAFLVRLFTDPGDYVLDPFAGSGSTILGAHQEGRISFGIELSPRYVDIACRRWQQVTGIKPVAEGTGEAHDFCGSDG